MRTENSADTRARHAVENAVAFTASMDSASLVDSLLDSYNPQNENAVWQRNSAKPKIKKFDSLTLIARKSCRETPWAARTSRTLS